ncbi:MAG: CBS domain-containing protein [Verrucomicrobiota bacterium]
MQTLTVASVAIPLSETITVLTETKMAEVLNICRERNVTRMPVIRRDAAGDKVIGLISLKKLLYLEELDLQKTAGDYVNPALYLREHLRLEEALRRMQRSGRRLAIVLGRDQREVGVVSLQDILKTIFGEVNL